MRNIFTILFAIFSLHTEAQKEANPDNSKIDFTAFWSNTVVLPEPEEAITPGFTISDIVMIDNRFDTSTLGFMQRAYPDTRRLLTLKNGTSNDIRSFLLSSINPLKLHSDTSAYKLICIIKKLWLSDEIYKSAMDQKDKIKGNDIKESGIMIRLEFLAVKNENYVPLYRFDTTITDTHNIHKYGGKYLFYSLTAALHKLITFSNEKISMSKKKISWEDLTHYNISRFNIPILLETPQKGAYVSFEEFRNNTPSIKIYSIKPGRLSDEIYSTNENGNEVPLRNIWGYSNGENIYLKSAGSFFKLYRSNNTFNIYGAKSVVKAGPSMPVGNPAFSIPSQGEYIKKDQIWGYSLKLNPFQLDMETGIIY